MILVTAIATMSISSICLILYCNYLGACYKRELKEAETKMSRQPIFKKEPVEEVLEEELAQA
jgi:hypothetical protein